MPKSSIETEIQKLWNLTQGDSQICVAILDGLVDQSHNCFNAANLTRLPTLIQGEATANGSMSGHGTHVASIMFGQHNSSELRGIAPQCRGLIVPIFGDNNKKLSQLDLSRAIEQAVNAGAHIINVSAGQITDNGEAEGWLDKAVQLCKDHNVLIVAAAGNDGCECLHVPASLPTVLAVGAMNDQGKPIDFSNWGESYQNQGILAPGEHILGAKPGGGTQKLSGTSFATPIVSGRVSIPGILSGRSVKLFSGQVVPVIEVPNTRGLYGWKVNTLVQAAIQTVQAQASEAQEESIRRTLGSFLSRIYYDLRNLGTTSQDRALNFASTNAFQAASTFAEAVATGMELDSITVEKSPFCRLDSDCWDVKLKFFDPENSRRAKKLFRFTIDVSDIIPVTLGEVRSWSTPY
jgi:subtilisin family serine protease